MIQIVITHETLYRAMKKQKFDVLCQYLHNQSNIELIAPPNFYQLFEKGYATYGSRGALRRGVPPTSKQKALISGLKRIIKIIDVADPNEEYKQYSWSALYIKLCYQIQAFGIWDDFQFGYKFRPKGYSSKREDIPYFIPLSEILRYLGKDEDLLFHDRKI